MNGIPYVPGNYLPTMVGPIVFWGSDRSERVAVPLVPDCVRRIEELLEYRPRRALHVVAYASNADARSALERDVAPSMLLAPYHADDVVVIALQAPEADPRNGDEHRMRRQICHELTHAFTAEVTGSTKRLGDGGCRMRLAAWVDEGFAEVVAARAADRPDVIETARRRSAVAQLSDEQLNAAFVDLASPHRELAFAIATVRAFSAVQRRGYRFVFEHLDDPAAWTV